jgi:IPT/TIG domain
VAFSAIAFYGMPLSEDFGFPFKSLGELAPDQAAQAMNRSHIHLSLLRTAASSSSSEAMACGCALVDVPGADTQLSKDDWRLLPECKPKAATPSITTVSPSGGTAGTQVTVSGSWFGSMQGTETVWLGTNPAAVVSWSSTQIVATVATGSQSGNAQAQQNGN